MASTTRGEENGDGCPETPRVVVFTQYFVPGSKAGGPIRSLDALTQHREGSYWVFTSDRDFGDLSAYADVPSGRWLRRNERAIYYVNTASAWAYLCGLWAIRGMRPDVYYFNSLWNRRFTLLPMLLSTLGVIPRRPVVLAPRGELLPGALETRSVLKRLALPVVRLLAQSSNAIVHATSPAELQQNEEWFPRARHVHIPDLFKPSEARDRPPPSTPSELRVCFIARLHPHKNLYGAIEALGRVEGRRIVFAVYGPTDVVEYKEKCLKLAEGLPENVVVDWVGPIRHEHVADVLHNSDIFLMPSKSENFGHSIREALAAGCIVLTSNATPFTTLINQAGLSTPEWGDVASFARELQRLSDASVSELDRLKMESLRQYSSWEEGRRHHRRDMLRLFTEISNQDRERR